MTDPRHAGDSLSRVVSVDRPVRLDSIDFAIALGLAALLIISGATIIVPGVTGTFHDDGIYVSTAKALANGHGYHLIDLPGAPRQTKYPILYPALLAIIWKIYPTFPENVAVMQWFTLLCGAAGMSLAYLYLVACAYAGRLAASAAVALAAATPYLAYIYTLTMSEALFSALVVAALWRTEWHLAHPSVPAGRALVSGIVLALPFICRSAGIVTIVAGLGVLAWRRLPFAWVLAGISVVSGPWLIWSVGGMGAWQAEPITGYYTDYAGAWTSVALPVTAHISAWNAFSLAYGTVALPLNGTLAVAGAGRGAVPLILALGITVWVSVVWAARRGRFLPIFLTLHGIFLLPWPWPPARFLVPLLPIILGLAFGAVRLNVGRQRALTEGLIAVAMTVLLATNGLLLVRRGAVNRAFRYPYHAQPVTHAPWRAFSELFDWVRNNTDEAVVLASPLDSMLSLYTGRRAFQPFEHRPDRVFYGMPGPPVGSSSRLTESLARAGSDYLVVMPMFEFSEAKAFEELVTTAMADGSFAVVYEGADSRFRVLRRTNTGP